MKALEQDVGCRLLDRLGKKVLLTQAGEQLLVHTQKILREMTVARESLQQLGKWGKGRLRLGASTTACQHILPPVLGEFKKRFPDSDITIEPGNTADILELLRTNKIDLAIALEPAYEEQFDFHPLFSDELAFLVSSSHPWAIQGHVSRAEIPKQNYILYNQSSLTFRMIHEYFREEQMVLNTRIELGSMEAIKELVKLNMGVSILAPWIAQQELANKSLVAFRLGKRKLKRQWGIVHWKNRRLGLSEETFISLCRKVTEDFHTFAPKADNSKGETEMLTL